MNDAAARMLELFRDEAAERIDELVAGLLELEQDPAQAEALKQLFRAAHSLKGSAGMVGDDETHVIAHEIENVLAGARETGALARELVDPLLRATDALRRSVAGEAGVAAAAAAELGGAAGGGGEAQPEPATKAPPEGGAEPGPAGKRNGPGSTEQARPANGGRPDEQAPPTGGRAAEPGAAPSNGAPADGGQAPQPAQPRSMRVDAGKVDRLLDAVGESVLHHRRLDHLLRNEEPAGDGSAAGDELERGGSLLHELQDAVIHLRTLPLEAITTRFPRAVRDLAATEGKRVELVITGAETPLDRVILEGISEAITHLLRNAVAHGIEPPEEREQAGKPAAGRIELRAEQRGDRVVIEVADDGRGVPAAVLREAERAGSLAEVLSRAGFSTAAAVSDVSGRGVGLDAVRAHVESAGGTLEARSAPGRGTTITLDLPLTLSLLKVLLVERAGGVFGFPVSGIEEVCPLDETMLLGGRQAVERPGGWIPLADIATVLGGSPGDLPPRPAGVVVASGAGRAAFACDRLLGDDEVVVKGLGPLLAGVPGYLGAAILGDGRIALIVDPSYIVRGAANTPSPARAPGAGRDGGARKVLVVDDQFTVREIQRSILESAGYRVETARDGREARDHLTRDRDVDLVVTDLEMPNMDGLELLSAIRSDPARASLPVVILTSRGSEEDERRGLEAGADAYIAKDRFDQRALLETVGRLVGA